MPVSRRLVIPLVAVACLFATWLVVPLGAHADKESQLRNQIAQGKARERQIGGALAKLNVLIAHQQKEVAIVQGRLDDVQSSLDVAQSKLDQTQGDLRFQNARLQRLRAKLASGRALLAQQLESDYKDNRPNVVSVILGAHNFSDLIDDLEFVDRIRDRNTQIVTLVKRGRNDADRQAARLAVLEKARAQVAAQVKERRDALASMRAGLGEREAALEQARAARAQALAGTRSGRQAAEGALSNLLAARAAAARAAAAAAAKAQASRYSGASNGPWAIPWAIVQCESGGQNLPPNYAGASGYYQMLVPTWKGLGGSTPQAYQASKAEQDRLAAKLWAGGSGAKNWVCAFIVGAI